MKAHHYYKENCKAKDTSVKSHISLRSYKVVVAVEGEGEGKEEEGGGREN